MLATDPATLVSNDRVDWGQLGTDGTALPGQVSATSLDGLVATATTGDPAGLIRLDEGSGWQGNFIHADKLINNNSTNYFSLTIELSSPVHGAGANIQLDNATDNNGMFVATIEAFAGNTSLGAFSETGFSNMQENGTAIFIGVRDTVPEITRVIFGILNPPATSGDFAINSLLIASTGVPEPSSMVLVMVGLTSIAFLSLSHRGFKTK